MCGEEVRKRIWQKEGDRQLSPIYPSNPSLLLASLHGILSLGLGDRGWMKGDVKGDINGDNYVAERWVGSQEQHSKDKQRYGYLASFAVRICAAISGDR